MARTDAVHYAGVISVPGRPLSDDPDCELFEPVKTNLGPWHVMILQAAQRCARTPYGRLMILCPPGTAKTTYASVVFPSHYLGEQGGKRLLLASYGDVPARRMGRRTRSVLMQPAYRRLFDAGLSAESRAAEQFTLTNGSEYFATSILGSVTSYRADGLIIDDPVKGFEAANSPDQRDKTWDAFQNDLKTRLVPGGWIIDIQTRWHENDLAGRLLPSDWKGQSGTFLCTDGFRWEVLCIQARCEIVPDPFGRKVGDYLVGHGFDERHWQQFECQPQTWSSLYQQRPAPLEGALFKPDKINVIEAEPAGVRWVRGWDLAASKDQGDWTAGIRMGKRPDNGRIVIADVARLQGSPDEVERTLVGKASQDGLTCEVHIPQDPGQAGKAQVQYLASKLVGYRVISSPETGDKVTRASPLAAQVNVGNVDIVRGSWNRPYIDELRVFPYGTYDDQVDGSSRAFAAITGSGRSYFG